MNVKQRLLSALLAALLLLPLLAAPAQAGDNACGDGLTWALADGTLTISKTDPGGTGVMADYPDTSNDPPPWYGEKDSITKAVIGDGVTSIGDRAFVNCGNLADVTIPGSVTSIGTGAFSNCAKLTSISIPSQVTGIGSHAFEFCGLTSVVIPSGLITIEDTVFQHCGALETVFIPKSVTKIKDGAFVSSGLKTVLYEGTEDEWKNITIADPNYTNILLTNLAKGEDGGKIEYSSAPPIDPDPPDPPAPVIYTVTFDAQGGSAVPQASVTSGDKITKPADPERSGYIFGGWFKESGCVTPWDFDGDAVTGDVTLYAKWTRRSSGSSGGGGGSSGGWYTPPAVYPVTIPVQPAHGRLSVSRSSAERGVTVRVTAVPEEGFRLEALRAVSGGRDVPLTGEGGGKYAFIMPAGPVEVEAVFAEAESVWVSPYADVAEGAWCYDAVRFVTENGLMSGYGDGRLAPRGPATRAQAAKMLWSFLER